MEHGVKLESYFKEMWTDYWQTPTETGAHILTAFPSMCLPRKRF